MDIFRINCVATVCQSSVLCQFFWTSHTYLFTLQLFFSTTRFKCTTIKTLSVATQPCWSVQFRVSSENTSLSHRGSRTPSSTSTQLQRAVSCHCATPLTASLPWPLQSFHFSALNLSGGPSTFLHRQYSSSHGDFYFALRLSVLHL